MAGDRSSAGDPARTLGLLWRAPAQGQPRPGPKRGRSVDDIVATAITLADAEGLDSLTVRRVAREMQVAPMTLYTCVPGKAELLDLMLDDVYRRMRHTDTEGQPWRSRVEAIAHDNRLLCNRHPWAAAVSTVRPPLGPGLMAEYERELRAFDDLGLDDVEMDAALTFVLGFVRTATLAEAQAEAAKRESDLNDQQWWEINEPFARPRHGPDRLPHRSARRHRRAGLAHAAAYSPEHACDFGLERVLDGLRTLIARRGS
ncbi:MAG: TetR/AcrR family transcriptional regulator [Egibacteraceae bacterium]